MLAMERWRVIFGPAVWWRPPESLSILTVHGRSMIAFLEHAPARLFATAVAAVGLLLAASAAIVRGPGIFRSNPQIDLVLLRYKLLRARCRTALPQHGQRGKRLTIAAMSLRRMVAIEFGMCRSGRKGGSSGSVTVGYGKLRVQRGGTRSGGGNQLPLLDQEAVGGHA